MKQFVLFEFLNEHTSKLLVLSHSSTSTHTRFLFSDMKTKKKFVETFKFRESAVSHFEQEVPAMQIL